jgi:hypothetical protein
VTAETPQPAAAEGAQPSAPGGAKASSTGNQQLRIAILVVVAALIGVGLWLAFGQSKHHKGNGSSALRHAVGPVALTHDELLARAGNVGQPIYWAGAAKGNGWHYEYTRRNDKIWVRYLPAGVKAGQKPAKLLIIGTYPLAHAYKALKTLAKGRGVTGKDGSFVWVRKGDPKSVYVVWPSRPYEVEVYSPNPSKAAKIAESGQITTVG